MNASSGKAAPRDADDAEAARRQLDALQCGARDGRAMSWR